MQKAMQEGYKVYLYYIATEDPDININRVQVRVAQAGHSVDPSTVRKRYQKSLGLLKKAVKSSNRAFLFDNSGEEALLVVQIDEGSEIHPNLPSEKMPYWVSEYLIG
jgi:predicted ABC-type ATPase